MQNSMAIFSNNTFGNIRTITIDDQPWFVGRDVAASLGFKQVVAAVRRKVNPEYKRDYVMSTGSGEQHITLINEQGIYNLVMNSRLPNAVAFQDWIYREVLPSIRKHGVYVTDEVLEMTAKNPRYIISVLQKYVDEQEKNKQLTCVNAALTEQIMKWDNRSVLNALIRNYGLAIFKGNYQLAWNCFYKELRYQQHIDLKHRARMLYTFAKKPKAILDCVKENEWPTVIKCAVAFCESKHVQTGEVLAHYNGDLTEDQAAS